MECIFCDFVNTKKPVLKVWEDNHFLVFLDSKPINPGHLLLIPKSHFSDIYDIPEPLYGNLFQTVKKIAIPLKEAMSAGRIGLAVEGFGVSHVHIHLVPVNKGNELNPERAKKVSDSELKQMREMLKKHFEDIK